MNSNHTCGHPHGTTENHERDAHGKYRDPGNGPEYEQGPEAGDGTDTNGKEGKTDSKGMAHQDDGEDNPGPSDEAYSEQTLESAGTTLDEEDPSEGSQVAIRPEERDPLQEDIGPLTSWMSASPSPKTILTSDVCNDSEPASLAY